MLVSAKMVGLLATLTLIGTSMAMNAIYLMGQGKTPEEAYVFLALSLAADAWKAVLPVLIAAAWAERRRVVAVAGGIFLAITLAFSFGSALGYAAQNRGFLAGTREFASAQLVGLAEEKRRLDVQLASYARNRASGVIEAEMAGLRTERQWTRSTACRDTLTAETREFCRRYRTLEIEMAGIAERQRLEGARRDVERDMARLVAAGAGQDIDAQVGFIVRMTGYASPVVRDLLIVAVAVVVEFGSAFGLLITGVPRRADRRVESSLPALRVLEPKRDVTRRIGRTGGRSADRRMLPEKRDGRDGIDG
jgi:hypothetical protein